MTAVRTSHVLLLTAAIGLAATPARAQWQPPIGIPAPDFGITNVAPAPPNPWITPTPGFYYVEAKIGATNINNPYGTPAKPRISIPTTLPPGSVVEVHGFYDQPHGSPNGIFSQGTASAPVFIRGVSSTSRPIIRRYWEVTGTYLILENLEFGPPPDQSTTGSLVIREPSNRITVRNSDVHGTLNEGGLAIVNWSGLVSGVQNAVVYKTTIHDNGDVNANFDQDNHGIAVGSYVDHVWVLENEMYRNSGDGIQINAGTGLKATTHHIYVGRNVSHHNKQTGFWVKQATDVVFSQNLAYAHRPGNSSMGVCMGGQYAPEYVWWLFNRVTDCEFGIGLMSDLKADEVSHTYYVGNVIFNIHKTTSANTPNDPWSPAAILLSGGSERHVVSNTIYNVDSGVNIPTALGTVAIKDNIINNVTLGNHYNFGITTVFNQSKPTIDHNLLYPGPRYVVGNSVTLLTASDLALMKSIAQNPQFRNPAAADFHITTASPAAAAGELSGVYGFFKQRYGINIFVDADGTPRPQTTWMDIGAYASTGWGVLVIDNPAPNATVGTSFTVSGWAIDRAAPSGSGVDAVHVWAFPAAGGSAVFLGAANYGQARPDVGAIFGARFSASGYSLNVPGLPYGSYTLTVSGHSTITGAFTVAATTALTVTGPAPDAAIVIDTPVNDGSSGSTLTVAGWAIDRAAPAGTGVDAVHVYAFPSNGGPGVFVGSAVYGQSRPDVGAAFGSRFTNSGFRAQATLPPGNYTIVAYAHSTLSLTFPVWAVRTNVTINATTSNPLLNIDAPSPNSAKTRPFTISGWAIDLGAATGSGIDQVHVYGTPAAGGSQFPVGAATMGISRPDVAAYFGDSRFTNCGFSISVTSATVPTAGTYDFQVYGRSTVTGTFSIVRVVRVTVQ